MCSVTGARAGDIHPSIAHPVKQCSTEVAEVEEEHVEECKEAEEEEEEPEDVASQLMPP